MLKRLKLILILAGMSVVFAGCGKSTDGVEEQRYAWPLGTSSPEDTVTQIMAEKFADEVSELSDGRMKIQVEDGVVSVTETTEAPDWSLSDTEAVRFLTSPEALYRNVTPKAVPRNWFPLSFGMSPLDEF